MKSVARIAVSSARINTLHSAPPLTLRSTPEAVYLVGSSAGPLGGDDLTLDIDVGEGAALEIRSAAASIALPGPEGRPSRMLIRARVAHDATLRWHIEPSVAAAGCNHSVCVHLSLAASARVVWREVIQLGRHNEEPGVYRSRLIVDLGGSPLLRHGLAIGDDGFDGPAVLAGARAVGSTLIVGSEAPVFVDEGAAVLPLTNGGALITAIAEDAIELQRLLGLSGSS
jgi:urease accessory protein